MFTRKPEPPATEPLLVDIRETARLLGCSTRHVEDLHREGKMPAARHLGRLLRWDVAELREWVKGGCPDRKAWEDKQSVSRDQAQNGKHSIYGHGYGWEIRNYRGQTVVMVPDLGDGSAGPLARNITKLLNESEF